MTAPSRSGPSRSKEAMSHSAAKPEPPAPPPAHDQRLLLVQRALRERSLLDESASLRAQMLGKYAFQNVISKSPRMDSVFEIVEQLSTTTTTVLINGETGSGKEQIARAIHNASSSHRKG